MWRSNFLKKAAVSDEPYRGLFCKGILHCFKLIVVLRCVKRAAVFKRRKGPMHSSQGRSDSATPQASSAEKEGGWLRGHCPPQPASHTNTFHTPQERIIQKTMGFTVGFSTWTQRRLRKQIFMFVSVKTTCKSYDFRLSGRTPQKSSVLIYRARYPIHPDDCGNAVGRQVRSRCPAGFKRCKSHYNINRSHMA